jgi:hypothetical protein
MPQLLNEKREGGVNLRQGKGGILIREEPYHFRVRADSVYQDRAAILLNTNGLPRFGQVFANGLSVKSMNADRDPEDATLWHVVVTTSTEVEDDQNNNNQNNQSSDPTTWTPIAKVNFEPYDEVLKEDTAGKKWVNSAKKPFETGLIRQRRIAVVGFSQFEPISTTLDQIMDRCDTVNSTTYKGKDAKKLLLSVENASVMTYGGFRCWRIDYQCKYKPDDWRVKQLDVGWGYYQSGEYKPFVDSEGNPYLGNLNGTGGKVANEATDEPAMLYFDGFEETNFNTFLRVLFSTA